MGKYRLDTSSQYAPATTLKMMTSIEKAVASLSETPQSCPLVSDDLLFSMGYRKMVVKKYIIFFTINEKDKIVDIERILHSRRDWFRIL